MEDHAVLQLHSAVSNGTTILPVYWWPMPSIEGLISAVPHIYEILTLRVNVRRLSCVSLSL